ncbi:MAG: phosphoribosylformylglycinamidine synthase subunit PurQ [Spirochaetes bacterium]|jgi:phosphoribosylformylglycinamidine synthase|nr:phosphoribosylformylglycinamidine synthase subunit PurQ [Spirochaetota bacterium]
MAKPRVLVMAGYGINCEEETAFSFRISGADPKIVHINDLITCRGILDSFQVFVFPGGFSYGDDTGSGRALANRIKNNLMDEIKRFIDRDTLMLGICNGFQVMVNIGLIPAIGGFSGREEVSLENNRTSRYECRWVDLAVNRNSCCVFTRGIETLHVPVAHGEGNFYAPPAVLDSILAGDLVALSYVKPDGTPAGGEFPYNPNGSALDIASICGGNGRIMGMMPHPERGIFFNQRDDWTFLRDKHARNGSPVPEFSDGIAIFKNAVDYFK